MHLGWETCRDEDKAFSYSSLVCCAEMPESGTSLIPMSSLIGESRFLFSTLVLSALNTTHPFRSLHSVLSCLSDGAGKEVRGAAYRVLRCALIRPPWSLIGRARSRGLDIFLTHTFLRDNRFEYEREQALKLVRAIVDAAVLYDFEAEQDRDDLISVAVIRALVAVTEHNTDKLRHLCLETLAELGASIEGCLARLCADLDALFGSAPRFASTHSRRRSSLSTECCRQRSSRACACSCPSCSYARGSAFDPSLLRAWQRLRGKCLRF